MFDKSLTKFVKNLTSCYISTEKLIDKNLSKFVKNLTSCYISIEKLIDKFFTNFDKFLSKYSVELDSVPLSPIYFYTAGSWTSSGSGYPANAVDTGVGKKTFSW
jgi:hypothetical protein